MRQQRAPQLLRRVGRREVGRDRGRLGLGFRLGLGVGHRLLQVGRQRLELLVLDVHGEPALRQLRLQPPAQRLHVLRADRLLVGERAPGAGEVLLRRHRARARVHRQARQRRAARLVRHGVVDVDAALAEAALHVAVGGERLLEAALEHLQLGEHRGRDLARGHRALGAGVDPHGEQQREQREDERAVAVHQ
ncbi:MAG: hypothetical protein R3F59_27890 [Myxococcota bacterium]